MTFKSFERYINLKLGWLCEKSKFLNYFFFYMKKVFINPKGKKFLKGMVHKNEKILLNDYNNAKNELLKKIINLTNGDSVFILLTNGGAGDICYQFVFLKEILFYLQKKGCSIFIITQNRFLNVVKLIEQYFEVKTLTVNDYLYNYEDALKEKEISKLIKDNSGIILSLFNLNKYHMSLFYHFGGKKWNIFSYVEDLENFFNKTLNGGNQQHLKIIKTIEYPLEYKLKFHDKKYNNCIICNLESKTFRFPSLDKIKFEEYYRFLTKLGKQIGKHFIINSVYNQEKIQKNFYVEVQRFTFLEIIYLAQHNKINLFISERNGLNDLLAVFFPKINQIIYYPEGPGVMTGYSKFELSNNPDYDVSLKTLREIPNNGNIRQEYRNTFFNTLEMFIEELSSNFIK